MNNDTGWSIGFVMFGVVVAAVVALVVPILLLANKIGRQAPPINSSCSSRRSTPRDWWGWRRPSTASRTSSPA